VLVARVEEQLRVLDVRDDLPRRVDVPLADEDRVVVGAMDLDRNALRPGPERPLAGDRDARVEQERTARAGTRLRQLLRDRLAERETRVHELVRQVVRGSDASLLQRIEALLLDEPHALVYRPEGSTVEQVRHVDGVAGRTQLVGEGGDARCHALGMVEEQDLGHRALLWNGDAGRIGPRRPP
jgi:hypothetical protein